MPLNLRRRFADISRCGDENVIESPDVIRFFHPGYGKSPISATSQPPSRDTLISLPALDDGGIHYDTAHTTCGVLAGNRWDGYFSLDRDGTTRVQQPVDGILRGRAYFFCLPQTSESAASTEPYPVVASFYDWRFPHRNLPPCWERLRHQFRADAQGAPKRCVLTDCGLSLDNAHLVPVNLSSWYDDNAMADYGKSASFSTDAVNVTTNIISLRTDVHRMFDERNFCFVPKPCRREPRSFPVRSRGGGDGHVHKDKDNIHDQNPHGLADRDEPVRAEQQPNASVVDTAEAQEDVTIVGHVFNSIPGGELQKLWHNREVFPGIYAASLECLFARFAWTIFSPNILRDFLLMTREPRILFVWDEDAGQYNVEKTGPARCKMTLKAARGRSGSPPKRPKMASDEDQDDIGWNEGLGKYRRYHEDGSSDGDSGYHGEPLTHWISDGLQLEVSGLDEEEPERGRSRKRKIVHSSWAAMEQDEEYERNKRVDLG